MRAALIRGGIVENIILVGEGFDPGAGALVVPIGDEPVSIGASWDGKAFTNPAPEPEPEPEREPELTRREQLIAAGFTEAQADAILALG